MKYLLPMMALLLALSGCDKNYPGNSAGVVTPPEKVVDNPLKSNVSRSGLYRLVRSSGVFNDPNTSTGKAVSKPVVQLVRTTERIPLIRGAQMYLQYRIWPLPEQPAYVDLRRVLKHPPMTLPDGSVSTGSDYVIKRRVTSNQLIAYTGYGLDEDYELVEGEWAIEIWYKDKKMIEQKFTTYQPDKEELATLEPLLALGNNVVGQIQSPDKSFSRFNWPRVSVGKTSN